MTDLIFLLHLALLHLLDGNYLTCLLIAANSNLSKGTFSDDFEWFEIRRADASPSNGECDLRSSMKFSLLVKDILLDELLLMRSEVEDVHLLVEHVPALFLLKLFSLQSCVLVLNVLFDVLSTLSSL